MVLSILELYLHLQVKKKRTIYHKCAKPNFDLLLFLCIKNPCLQIGTLTKTVNTALESLKDWMSSKTVSLFARHYMAFKKYREEETNYVYIS